MNEKNTTWCILKMDVSITNKKKKMDASISIYFYFAKHLFLSLGLCWYIGLDNNYINDIMCITKERLLHSTQE